MKSIIVSLLLVISLDEVLSSDSKRLLLHDQASIAAALQQLGAKMEELNSTIARLNATYVQDISQLKATQSQDVAQLKATHSQDVAQLKAEHAQEVAALTAGLNAEKRERCRTGAIGFHREECAAQKCTESQVIHFSPPFTKPPVVTIALSAMDIDGGRNIRISSSVSAVTTSSATLTVNTWADTIVFASALNWIACPNM